ncbi:tetratricopeptide repeat protein [Vulgatibacter sp.]|uniref:tetratricopeptide repeat protein n=1 Tax=Vulgatibacter sp. TaxID=1971226 RepID=UPI00356819AD
MINLGISLLVGLGVFGIFTAIFSPLAAILPGLIAFAATYVVLAQRAMKEIGRISEQAQKEMMAQKLDRALDTFRSGFPLAKRQFLVGPILHANVGTLLYVKRDFEAARPHLEQGFSRNYLAKAMLGAYLFKKGADVGEMKKAFETAVKHGKKDGLVWAVYAYCLEKLGRKDEAMQVLARGVEANPSDERLKSNLTALQNNKKLKMRAFAPQFYQFHLEAPPPEFSGGGRRVVYQRR